MTDERAKTRRREDTSRTRGEEAPPTDQRGVAWHRVAARSLLGPGVKRTRPDEARATCQAPVAVTTAHVLSS